MLLSIVEYFIPAKENPDQEYQRRAILVVYTVFITAIFALFYIGVSWVAGYALGILIMVGCFIGDIIILYFIRSGWNVIKAANMFGLVGTLSIYGCIYYSGGIYSPVFPWLAETPIIILLIAGKRSGFIWVAISILLIMLTGIMSYNGFIFPRKYNLANETFFYLSCIGGLVLIIFLTSLIFEIVRVRAYSEIIKQKDELYVTLSELKTTQNQLIQAEKMASLGELTAGIAHEIQNPLNFVNNFSEVSEELCGEFQAELQLLALSEEGKIPVLDLLNDLTQNLQKINFHGKRADTIIKNMLLHSRSNSGQKQATDLNALADEYLRLSYHGFRAKDKTFNASIVTDFDPQLGKVNVVAQDIGRVLLNLYNNAFYAVQQKHQLGLAEKDALPYLPQITLSTKNLGSQVEIRLQDNGMGIPEAIKEKILQPFFTTKPAGQGTGLGLSLSYDIINAHGGTLKIESEEGIGSSFSIFLSS